MRRNFKLFRVQILLCFLCGWLWATPVKSQLTAEQVKSSIRNGVRYLKGMQKSTGRWGEPFERFKHGREALCTLALLNAGVDKRDPVVVKALRVITELEPKRIRESYTGSVKLMVFCKVNPDKYRTQIDDLVSWLEELQLKDGGGKGGWGYSLSNRRADNSCSQFALLALHEAAKVGAEVSPDVWLRSMDYWLRVQGRSGGFGYLPPEVYDQLEEKPTAAVKATGSMTCAGISSLVIAQENFSRLGLKPQTSIECCGKESDSVNTRIDMAVNWMGDRFSVKRNPNSIHSFFYYLYGMERAARLAGRRFFRDHDWYREGAEELVMSQLSDGSWKGEVRPDDDKLISTSFALMFLSKGKRPILIGKYKIGKTNDWNRHHKGVHYLTRQVGLEWKRELNWQTVDGNRATVNDLLESPVLFISGKEKLVLNDKQKVALVDFVNQGGFIFAEACNGDGCDGKAFDQSFRSLMRELFRNDLEPLPPEHPVWFSQKKILPNPKRPLLGLQACCRTSVIYCNRNLSCLWQRSQKGIKDSYDLNSQKEIEYAIDAGVNILTYATNKELQEKLARNKIELGGERDISQREKITLAKLMHSGGADDAAVAVSNLMQIARRETGQPFTKEKYLLSPTDEKIKQHPFLFIHGRRSFEFSEEERAELRKSIIERRFFLFGDAICGSKAFAGSFKKQIELAFPDAKWTKIPREHPIFSKEFGGYDIRRVTLRTPRKTAEGKVESIESKVFPELLAIEIDDRFAIIFSDNDLSCALENSGSSECVGYTTEDANKIGINLLLYALQN